MGFTSETAKKWGKVGGLKTKAIKTKDNPNYYSDLGLEGGKAMLKKYGKDYFSEIGQMSAKDMKERKG